MLNENRLTTKKYGRKPYSKVESKNCNECVTYRLNNDRIEITRNENQGAGPSTTQFITPDEITISNLLFTIIDDQADAFHAEQPRITMKMTVEMATSKYKERIIV